MAGHLGMTVGELLRRMDSRELSEWMAYGRLMPIGLDGPPSYKAPAAAPTNKSKVAGRLYAWLKARG